MVNQRVIQILEDMLRACVLDFGGNWADYLPLAEFAYNNSYQSSIGMAPYEALYGRPCRSPLCWIEMGESRLLGPEIVQETTERYNSSRKNLRLPKIDRKVMQTKEKALGEVYSRSNLGSGLARCSISEDTSYVEEPLRILEVGEHRFRNKVIPQSKCGGNTMG
ncbi:hypothetical protein CK203_061291 [Vitis vinifera]|uniref:Transposon Ty3-I Gag-Pol polyprotein n=1 Tax=Vitis vinifera TaxID=29760 RepID=A0A438G847_VITVI|nr:hypothetical protein CK203_061291 [Vitis vinifera]